MSVTDSPHWRWMPGMKTDSGFVVVGVFAGVPHTSERNRAGGPMMHQPITRGDEPDPTDPATLGCLLALVREAWGDPGAACARFCDGWAVIDAAANGVVGDWGNIMKNFEDWPTEWDALVAALMAAPAKEAP